VWVWYDYANRVRLSRPDESVVATSLELRDLEGLTVSLDAYRGRVVLVNLWASWCPPCRAEIPRLNRLDRALGASGLIVLGVNVEGLATEQLSRLREEMGIDYRVVVPETAFQGAFEWNGVLPYTWLVDRNGRVRAGHGGLPIERSLRSACETLLGETG
jgi:thiol-disulfide isomerase/thioredoxin